MRGDASAGTVCLQRLNGRRQRVRAITAPVQYIPGAPLSQEDSSSWRAPSGLSPTERGAGGRVASAHDEALRLQAIFSRPGTAWSLLRQVRRLTSPQGTAQSVPAGRGETHPLLRCTLLPLCSGRLWCVVYCYKSRFRLPVPRSFHFLPTLFLGGGGLA